MPHTDPTPTPRAEPTVRLEELSTAERLTLALARLAAWREDPADLEPGWTPRVRSWKGYSFQSLDRLAEAGLIMDRPGNKTMVLTPEGQAFADQVLLELAIAAEPIPTRGRAPARPSR